MGFKTPDGKVFETRAEWRDYMMATFYSFKGKKDEPQPLIKEVTKNLSICHVSLTHILSYSLAALMVKCLISRIVMDALSSSWMSLNKFKLMTQRIAVSLLVRAPVLYSSEIVPIVHSIPAVDNFA
jgi:hypothetical protein